jgi:hypothetical protein
MPRGRASPREQTKLERVVSGLKRGLLFYFACFWKLVVDLLAVPLPLSGWVWH